MLSRRVLLRALSLTLACASTTATAARAADANSFARQIALSYHVDPRHVIAADIDRDGDLDVLAATDDGFKVWVNDGFGRFTPEAPATRPLVDGHPAGTSWNGGESLDHETIQSGSTPVVASYSHLSSDSASRSNVVFDVVVRGSAACGYRIPRAPPFI